MTCRMARTISPGPVISRLTCRTAPSRSVRHHASAGSAGSCAAAGAVTGWRTAAGARAQLAGAGSRTAHMSAWSCASWTEEYADLAPRAVTKLACERNYPMVRTRGLVRVWRDAAGVAADRFSRAAPPFALPRFFIDALVCCPGCTAWRVRQRSRERARRRCRRQRPRVRWPRQCRPPHHLAWQSTTRSFFSTHANSESSHWRNPL